MSDLRLITSTAVTPVLWGTTYLVTTEFLPPGRPLLAAVLRALPAGLLILAALAVLVGRRALPVGPWWWRAPLLGLLNIGLFFALLFIAAYRLPGGVAAVVGALGPFVVSVLAFRILGQRPTRRMMAAAAVGVAGVVLLVLHSAVVIDPLGIAAAAAGMLTMSTGTVLGRKWGTPAGFERPAMALLALTGWQLTAGGLLLLPIELVTEGMPPALSARNLLGFGYLGLIGTTLAYLLWFRGVTRMRPARVTLLALLSPLTAALLGWIVLGQSLTGSQLAGALAVVGAVVIGTSGARHSGGVHRSGQGINGNRGGLSDQGVVVSGVLGAALGQDGQHDRGTLRRPEHGDVVSGSVAAVAGLVTDRPARWNPGPDQGVTRGVSLEPAGQLGAVLGVQGATQGVLLQVGAQGSRGAGVADVSGDGLVQPGLQPVDVRGAVTEPSQVPTELLRPAEFAKQEVGCGVVAVADRRVGDRAQRHPGVDVLLGDR
jgi:probable blue pigment (indigoidine) exporter